MKGIEGLKSGSLKCIWMNHLREHWNSAMKKPVIMKVLWESKFRKLCMCNCLQPSKTWGYSRDDFIGQKALLELRFLNVSHWVVTPFLSLLTASWCVAPPVNPLHCPQFGCHSPEEIKKQQTQFPGCVTLWRCSKAAYFILIIPGS